MDHPPTIGDAVQAFFEDFDFGDDGKRTRLSYRSGARAFLRFIDEHPTLRRSSPLPQLPSSVRADFNAWMQIAQHHGPGIETEEADQKLETGYSPSSRRLYLQALNRLLRFWWYREWLTFSPEEEQRALQALQIHTSKEDRQRVQSRSDQVPTDFGDRMLAAAQNLPLPSPETIRDAGDRHKLRLETLRTRALVQVLRATALRGGDVSTLKRTDMLLARQSGGHLRLDMAKTGLTAHIVLGETVLTAIDTYIKERKDTSPWVFIQHGRTGAPPRGKALSAEAYRRRTRGYGARLSPGSIRSIVVDLAVHAGYDPSRDGFLSTHAFRHWHAQRLIDLGASIDQVQSILGHARAQTTKDVYAPEPNIPEILRWEEKIQRAQ